VCVCVCVCFVELHVTLSCTEILIVVQQCVYIKLCRHKPSGTTTGVFVSDFNQICCFCTNFFQKSTVHNSTEIRAVGPSRYVRTDRRMDVTKLTGAFRDLANAHSSGSMRQWQVDSVSGNKPADSPSPGNPGALCEMSLMVRSHGESHGVSR